MPEGKKGERIMRNGEVVKFNYPEFFVNHQKYRGSVENKNGLRHDGRTNYQIGLESSWVTIWWTIIFFFFIACTEVNADLSMKYLLKKDDICMEFLKIFYLFY